jgi:hypothetical protein
MQKALLAGKISLILTLAFYVLMPVMRLTAGSAALLLLLWIFVAGPVSLGFALRSLVLLYKEPTKERVEDQISPLPSRKAKILGWSSMLLITVPVAICCVVPVVGFMLMLWLVSPII